MAKFGPVMRMALGCFGVLGFGWAVFVYSMYRLGKLTLGVREETDSGVLRFFKKWLAGSIRFMAKALTKEERDTES